jgi:pilus assembly protein CpaC
MTSITCAVLVTVLIGGGVGPVAAQTPQTQTQTQTAQPPAAPAPAMPPSFTTAPPITVMVVTGGSTVVKTDFPITRIAINNPAVADATVVDPRQLLVDGKTAGTVSLIVWGAGQQLVQYEITVYPPTPALQRQFKQLFPNEDIQVSVSDEAVVLSGRASTNAVALRAMEIAEKSSSKHKVINMLDLPGGTENQQVMLQVRVAEVARRALTEFGVSLFTGASGYKDWVGRTSTQQFAAPGFEGTVGPQLPGATQANDGKLTFSDFLNLFVFNTKYDVGAVVTALKSRGFFQSLAEPTLIAYNGQEASFLAGGEIPVPIAQGGANAGAISVSYKEFGVRLTFRPTIAGDVIRMKVKPEVSQLDFANGITLQGFRIPALSTRRAETDVELRDGQSFAIGGLMNNMAQSDRAGIPGLSDLPIIGHLFKSRADRKEQTELVVIITPRLVRPMNAGQPPALPTVPERFLRPDEIRQIDGRPAPPAGDAAEQTPSSKPASTVCVAFWCR